MDHVRFLFLKLNLWLCLGSGLMVAISALALSVPLRSVGVGLVLPPLLFYFIYVEDRRNVSPEDEINHPHRTALVRRYASPLLVTEVVALIGYEVLLAWIAFGPPDAGFAYVALGQLPLLVLALYEHLKRHPSFDSLAVGATWTFVTVFSLVATTTQRPAPDLGWIALAWFAIVFAGVESRNVLDAEGDRESDRTTLAGYLGPGPTTVLVLLLKASGALLFWAVSGVFAASLVVGYLVLLRLFRTVTRREPGRIEKRSGGGCHDRNAVRPGRDPQ